MVWWDHPIVTALLILNFTFGFFFALFSLIFFWRKEARGLALEMSEKPDLIQPFMKYPAFMFFAVWVGGLVIMLIIVV